MRHLLPSLRPFGLLAAAACLVFPLAWNRVAPRLTGPPVVRVLNAPAGTAALPVDPTAQRARLLRQASEGAVDPNDAFPALRYRAIYEVDLSRGGRYSVYGISGNDRAQPVELTFDDRTVRATAFWWVTGSRESDFERRRLATGVTLPAGVNRVELWGVDLPARAFALELREEAPLSGG